MKDQPPPPPPQQIPLQLDPKVGEGIYSNLALISHSPFEVFIDFARFLPGLQKATVQARIVMTPAHAKMLLNALKGNLERFEKDFGEIKMPGKEQQSGNFGFQPMSSEHPPDKP
jgi:hypothetical protein